MPEFDLITYALIGVASVSAGFIDSAVGGGGMITVPTLFTLLPQGTLPATVLGTNKLSAVGGTLMAALQYARQNALQWRLIVPAMVSAGLASVLGAYLAGYIPVELFKKGLPPVLAILLIYTFANKKLGQTTVQKTSQSPWIGVCLGGLIGVYDGVFGPGTGSFLSLLWIKGYGFDFIKATAHAKWVNVATNIGAISWFAAHDNLLIMLGLMMTACNTVGAFLGARVTMRYGNAFVRKLFILVMLALIARTTYDAYWR
jgi:uncharacterized protein